MKYLFLFLTIFTTQSFALEPSRLAPVTNDTFAPYQWALKNEGQTIYRDLDDIHPIIVQSKKGFDIQWEELQGILKSKNRKETVVAIVDSGVSTSHEEIKENVLPGFNFTAPAGNEKLQKEMIDDLGHGTHIAGIIASHISNATGIAGVASNIKILPLKVYSAKRENDQKAFIVRVTKAIEYAVEKKVDVINLSMGWPLMIDQKAIREAIQKALDQNITVVAGAGNDGHALRVLPCSYDGVICVGATGIGGDIPGFSNYGGQVDMMAPGESILSLWPPILMPSNFGLKKYNISSGTSQAAPFVSAAAAILKSVYPEISNDEIKARLFASSKMDLSWDQKFALNGLLQIANAIKIQPQSVIRPNFKALDQIYVNSSTQEFEFVLPIRNYWISSGVVQIKIDSKDPGIQWRQKNYSVSGIPARGTSNVRLAGKIKSLSQNNKLKFSVEVKYASKTEIYTHEATLALRADQIQNLSVYPNVPELRSIMDFNTSDKNAEFYSQKITDAGLELRIFRFIGGKLLSQGSFFIPGAVNLYPQVGLVRNDMNYDGKDDFFVTAIIKKDKEVSLRHFVLDQNLKLALGENSVWDFVDEGILIHQPSLKFVEWQSKDFGRLALPIFWSKGPVPAADLNPDPFERVSTVPRGIYYYMPELVDGKVKLKTRLLTNDQNVALIRKKTNARFNEELHFLHLKIKNQKEIEVLVGVGISANLKYYNLTLDLNSNDILVSEIDVLGSDLRFHVAKKMSDEKISFFGIYKNDLARLVIIDTETNQTQSYKLKSNSPQNGIVSLLSVTEDAGTISAFVEGVESFILYTINKETGAVTYSIDPINRFSYLPGQYFTDILYPLDISNKSSIYVDSSWINSRNVHSSTMGAQGIVTPIEWSLELADQCIALTPKKLLDSDKNVSYVFLCKETSENYSLKTYEL